MLFYAKKYLWLDLLIMLLFGDIGYWGIQSFSISVLFAVTPRTRTRYHRLPAHRGVDIGGSEGLRPAQGTSLCRRHDRVSRKRVLPYGMGPCCLQGLTAALGEEVFFRALIQGQWGLLAGSAAFGLLHFGGKDIRVVSYWSYVHGLLFGLSYSLTDNFVVPVLTHGLFDLGGVLYFQLFRSRLHQEKTVSQPVGI